MAESSRTSKYVDFELRLFCHFLSRFLSSVNAERRGSSIDAALVVSEGDASATLTKLKVMDEGTYICTVSIGHFHAQQVIQLHIIRKCHPKLISQCRKNLWHIFQFFLCCSSFQNRPVFHSQRRSWF